MGAKLFALKCGNYCHFWAVLGPDRYIYITFALLDDVKYPEISNLLKKVQTQHHTTTCGKEKGVASSLMKLE